MHSTTEHLSVEKDTGSAKSQITVFTQRISHLTEHLSRNRKDYAAKKALLDLVSKRRRMLKYMSKKEPEASKKLRQELSLRGN